jgi:hypothetical protein
MDTIQFVPSCRPAHGFRKWSTGYSLSSDLLGRLPERGCPAGRGAPEETPHGRSV